MQWSDLCKNCKYKDTCSKNYWDCRYEIPEETKDVVRDKKKKSNNTMLE